MKTLKKELASIGDQYADRHGYINYGNADDFEWDMADFIGWQTQTLLGRGEPLLAFRAGMDALREYASYEVEEGCAYIDDAIVTFVESETVELKSELVSDVCPI